MRRSFATSPPLGIEEASSCVIRCDAPKGIDLYILCEDLRAAGRERKERGDKKGLECVFLAPLQLSIRCIVLMPFPSTEETVSKLADCTGTGLFNFLDEVRTA